jgi:NAD(P)-dependent dehydrogenase (short-subunit alcohol dehydrogenase family)
MSRAALVTGGGTGIGAAIARRLRADGYDVCVTGRRREPLDAVAAETGAFPFQADTGDKADAEKAVAAAKDAFGRLDVLVCNAGIGLGGTVEEQSPEGWDAVLRTNLTGAFLACRAALPELVQTRGSVVTISSDSGLRAAPASAAYCTAKAGLIMLTQCIALDYGPLGVRANCICPGWVRTPMADEEMDELAELRGTDREGAYELVASPVPLRRPGSPQEIASAVAWLVSDEAGFTTGAVVAIDGGNTVVDPSATVFTP